VRFVGMGRQEGLLIPVRAWSAAHEPQPRSHEEHEVFLAECLRVLVV